MTGFSVAENVPLAHLTTLAVGGPARYLTRVSDAGALSRALAWARDGNTPVQIIGGGSNILVADRGYSGLILQPAIRGTSCTAHGDRVVVEAGAGESWDALVAHTVASNLAGLECLSGIPGWVGATPVQNVGAYGQEVADCLTRVHAIRKRDGEALTFERDACGFAYRTSHFKETWREELIITQVVFDLRAGGPPTLRYRELQEKFRGTMDVTLAATRAAVLATRAQKSMLYDTSDANHRSAGSFFTNPIVKDALVEELASHHPAMPVFPAPPGHKKLSAGWLIEQAGFTRGYVDGRVGLSSAHALALINRGDATAADILRLAGRIRRACRESFGITLVPEPVFVGFDAPVDDLI